MVVFPIERDSQRSIIIVAIVFSALAITACGLRVLARRIAHRTLDSSDWCIFAACVSGRRSRSLALGLSVLTIFQLVTVTYQSINVTSMSAPLS
jgi:hypothetical protein